MPDYPHQLLSPIERLALSGRSDDPIKSRNPQVELYAKVHRMSFDAGLTTLQATKWHLYTIIGGIGHYDCSLRSDDNNQIGDTGATPAEALWAAIDYARSLD
jgi:hypothetical protein